MGNKDVMIIAEIIEQNSLSRDELCEVCQITYDYMNELIAFEVVHPKGKNPADWRFEVKELQKVKKVLRLQQDLEVNIAGAAVALDLLDQLEEMRQQLRVFQKHF